MKRIPERFDFETPVTRNRIGNMKHILLREAESESGRSDMLVLSGAEMDFGTAPVIRRAIQIFADNGLFGYTLADARYREAVIRWMRDVRHFLLTDDELVPTLGTIFSLGTALRAFTKPGDAVIIPHPSYYRFDACIRKNGRVVISNPMQEQKGRYALDFDHLEAAMSRARMMVLCNPHNPTGTVFSRADLLTIRDLAAANHVFVYSDEIFAETVFGNHVALPYVDLDPEYGITSTSLGKVFSLTGFNHANIVIKNSEHRCRFLQQRNADHYGSMDPFAYQAVLAGYTAEGLDWVEAMNAHVYRQYEEICAGLRETLPYLAMSPLEGSYVGWLDCRALLLPDEILKRRFLHAGLVLDPGSDYGPGGSGFMRINIATTSARTDSFLTRLRQAVSTMSPRPLREV